jgi:CRISPR-associated protein Cas2
MRRRYLVSYDVSDAKRLRQAFRAMHGFGNAIQYSVFLCDLSAVERQLMRERLMDVPNLREDRALIVDLGEAGARTSAVLDVIGRQVNAMPSDFSAVIV